MRQVHTAIQIDSAFPVLWEDTTTLRVGFDSPVARVEVSSPAAQRVVARLLRGASAEELAVDGARVAERVLAALEPALVRHTARGPDPVTSSAGVPQPVPLNRSPRRPAAEQSAAGTSEGDHRSRQASRTEPQGSVPQLAVRASISDDGREIPGLRAALGANQVCSFPRTSTPDLVIEVLRFLEPLGRTSRWLGTGTPHLVIRLSDAAVRVGPLISSHGSPCHGCETLHLTDSDPALPALASQLYGGVPSSETPETAQLIAATAAYFVRSWRRGEGWVHTHQLVLPVQRGTVTALPHLAEVAPHPECGCAISSEPRPPPQTSRGVERFWPRSQSLTAATRRARA